MSYQTSGAGADVSPGGVRMNIDPKDGGNRFSGAFFAAWTDKAFQSDNLTDDIVSRGLRFGPGVDRIYDFNLALGGPIKRDKLWFFTSMRAWSVNSPVADVFNAPSGTPYRQASPAAAPAPSTASRASTTRRSRARCCASPGRSRPSTSSRSTTTRSTSSAATA